MIRRRKGDEPEDKKQEASAMETGMNREMKRMMKKREGAADRLRRPPAPKKRRAKPGTYLKEVRGELGRVSWPTRSEVITYTLVVLVSVAFFMSLVSAMDIGFSKAVFWVIDTVKGR